MIRRPSLVFLLFLLLFAMAFSAVAFLFLPQMKLPGVVRSIKDRTGLQLSADASPSFSFDDGFLLRLRNIVLASEGGQTIPVLQAVNGDIRVGLFSNTIDMITLEDALVSFDLSDQASQARPKSTATQKPLILRLRNSALKLSKRQNNFNLALTDLNGEVRIDEEGALLIDARFLLNGRSTHLTAVCDDVQRLSGDGSPSDIAMTSGDHTLTASGRARISPVPTFDGSVTAHTDDVNGWMQWLGVSLRGFDQPQSMILEGGMSLSPEAIKIVNSNTTIGAMKASGDYDITLNDNKPHFTANLKMPLLDLNAYLDPETPLPADPKPRSLLDPWSERKLDFTDLNRLTLSTSIEADEFRFGHFRATKAKTTATLNDGIMALSLTSDQSFGGSLAANLRLQAGDAPQIHFKSSITNADATALLTNLFGFSALGGALSLELDVSAKGMRETELLATAAGAGQIKLEQAKINAFDATKLLEANHQQGWPMATTPSPLPEAAIEFSLLDGIAKINKGRMKFANDTSLSGEIDILRRALDITLTAGNRSRQVKGPWHNPAFAEPQP